MIQNPFVIIDNIRIVEHAAVPQFMLITRCRKSGNQLFDPPNTCNLNII